MGKQEEPRTISLDVLDVGLNRDGFMTSILRELSGALQEVVGRQEAFGFVSLVGQRIGEQIDRGYREALGDAQLTRDQVAAVLVDLKRRIAGDFYLIEQTPERIVLGNRRCPFGDKVKDRPSLCMMTSNVFGVIASENLGFAKVELAQTIAEGASECRVIVHLEPTEACEKAEGRTYIRTGGGETHSDGWP